ncbi:MAG: DUF488 family protein [Pseudonocardiaceae bacterium]
MQQRERTRDIVGTGYEGLTADEFLRILLTLRPDVLVDVRLTPISRKRGLSKKALASTANELGIRYEHLPQLGNPKDNRAGFAGDATALATARARYRERLESPAAYAALAQVRELAYTGRVALLCFEADQERCHRHVLLQQLDAIPVPAPMVS